MAVAEESGDMPGMRGIECLPLSSFAFTFDVVVDVWWISLLSAKHFTLAVVVAVSGMSVSCHPRLSYSEILSHLSYFLTQPLLRAPSQPFGLSRFDPLGKKCWSPLTHLSCNGSPTCISLPSLAMTCPSPFLNRANILHRNHSRHSTAFPPLHQTSAPARRLRLRLRLLRLASALPPGRMSQNRHRRLRLRLAPFSLFKITTSRLALLFHGGQRERCGWKGLLVIGTLTDDDEGEAGVRGGGGVGRRRVVVDDDEG
ncbi:uncharacterized protein IWZ02DRAFT_954 [Phyllosticta citriasiana]|uniref:uncharacterized protein n=1 Tax=Phyllosticta citriasiana TaxID=595635 RepID=UPI0030FDD42D